MKAKEIKMTLTSDPISVSAERLWEIAGPGFADVGAWTSSIDRSTGIGSGQFEGAPCNERRCEVNITGYSEMTETLTHYDVAKRQLAYELTKGLPGFVLLARNHWTVLSLGSDASALELNATLRLSPLMGFILGGMMKRTAMKEGRRFLEELKNYAERGALSERKQRRLSQLGVPVNA